MTTTQFTGADGNFSGTFDWYDPGNWTNGVPQAGETVPIDDVTGDGGTYISFSDLALSEVTVVLAGAVLQGNVLTLSNTSLTGGIDLAVGDASEISTQDLVVGRGSFVGVAAGSTSGDLAIASTSIVNAGVIGSESGGLGRLPNVFILPTSGSSLVSIDNIGRIVATNGGVTEIDEATVYGSGNLVVNNGGILNLFDTGIASGEKLHLGGTTGSTLNFDPLSSVIEGGIYGFARTDLIDLQHFTGTAAVVAASTTASTVQLTGTDAGQSVQFSLDFQGNYTSSHFSTVADASGRGTLLLVNHA